MDNLVPTKQHLREVLIFCFHRNKTAAETHRELVETYGEHAISEPTCREWFRRFKSGNFDVEDQKRSGQPKKFTDSELKALLDENVARSTSQLAEILCVERTSIGKRLRAMGMVYKEGKWVSRENKLSSDDHS